MMSDVNKSAQTLLAARMDERRIQLRRRWDEIAKAADISTGHLRKIRSGDATASDLAKANLETALQWERGSIDTILAAEQESDQQAQARRESIVSNPIYGKPPAAEPARLLADAVEVVRPNGTTVQMDLVALADVVIGTERALAELRHENADLKRRIGDLESKAARHERAAKLAAGLPTYGSDEDE